MKGFIKGSTFIQAVVFGLLLASSTLGLAQDLNLNSETEGLFEQVNINQADAEAIAQALSGIGIVKAEAIVAYRDENGSFNTVDDLIMVNGVGEFTVLNNQDKILFE